MGEQFTEPGSVVAGFVGLALVVFGGYRVRYGTGTGDELLALTVLAVAVVAGYHSLTIDAGARVNAVGNTALFVAGATAYGGGVRLDVDPVATAGQALFAIAVAYLVLRLY